MTPRICSNSPKISHQIWLSCWKIHGFLGFPCENPPSVGQAFAVCLGTYPIHKASGVTKKTVQLIGTPGGRPTAKRDTGQGLKQQDIESLRDETNCWGIPNGVHLTKTATLNNQKKGFKLWDVRFLFSRIVKHTHIMTIIDLHISWHISSASHERLPSIPACFLVFSGVLKHSYCSWC